MSTQCSSAGVLAPSSSASDVSVTVDTVSTAVTAEEPSDRLVGGSGSISTLGSLGTANDREGWNSGQSLEAPVADQEPTGSYRDAGSVEKSMDSGSVLSSVKQQRFHFESDSLVLKDNPE